MKKLVLLTMMLVGNMMLTFAQNDTILYIEDYPESVQICLDKYDRVLIYAEEGCENYVWYIWGGQEYFGNPVIYENLSVSFFPGSITSTQYYGCNVSHWFQIFYTEASLNVPNSFSRTIWKRCKETVTLEPLGIDTISGIPTFTYYDFLWSNGDTIRNIEVSEPGTYTCEITAVCGSATRTFIVKDNVEVYRATVDLETNLNKTTWQVTEAQAEYISEVKVYRDGLLVGTVPYEQGYFLDAIGSDNAARNYRIVGVTTEGEDCPIESYEKGTIHTTYYQDVNNNLNMTWNIPYVEEGAQGTLTYFQICKYDPNTEELTVVDQVNASITDYTCGVNQFDGGYAVIAAVFNDGKGLEELSFSNLTTDILGVGEDALNTFRIYPNPSNGTFTVEGAANITVYNALGQVVATCRDGACTVSTLSGSVAYQFTLPPGIYTVRNSDGVVRKVVVE